jgi:hypothetical protein
VDIHCEKKYRKVQKRMKKKLEWRMIHEIEKLLYEKKPKKEEDIELGKNGELPSTSAIDYKVISPHQLLPNCNLNPLKVSPKSESVSRVIKTIEKMYVGNNSKRSDNRNDVSHELKKKNIKEPVLSCSASSAFMKFSTKNNKSKLSKSDSPIYKSVGDNKK